MQSKKIFSRRSFLTNAATIGVGGSLASGLALNSCSAKNNQQYTPLHPASDLYIPYLPDKAVEGKPVKAVLIGCGGRGTGAAFNLLEAGDNVSIVALADVFQDKIDACRKQLKEKLNVDIPDDMCFAGFDAYKKVCELPVDLVLIASVSGFHPEQLKCAVDQGKHVFVEKPLAVDPAGYRTCVMALKQAKTKGLNVISGANSMYSRAYIESYQKIQEGYIGKILSGNVFYNTGNENFLQRKPEWSDMEYMIRSHFNWNWCNGDQICNLLIHQINVFIWFSHLKPLKAIGFGSRIRRKAGNVYDNFTVDFEFEGGVHLSGMVRRIDGCDNFRGITIQGDKGSWNSDDHSIKDLNGNLVWKYDEDAAKAKYTQHNAFTLELVDMINQIRKGTAIDIAETTAISSLACIMARESAYTGKTYTWEQMITSDLNMMPPNLALTDVDMEKFETVPLPGIPGKDA